LLVHIKEHTDFHEYMYLWIHMQETGCTLVHTADW
jgi:hypothetical protein